MPFCVLGFSPRLVCQLIPKTPNGLQTGSCGAESRVTCPLSCFPISPTWILETPALPVPVSRGCQHGFPGAHSPRWPFGLRTCTASSQLLFTLALTLLVPLTWPRPTQPGLSLSGRCDCLPGLPLPSEELLSLSRWGGLACWDSSPMGAALNCSCEDVDGLRPQLPSS